MNGVAAAAGVSIALACDIVVAARSARFVLSFDRLGLVPDFGGTWILPRPVGQARALGAARQFPGACRRIAAAGRALGIVATGAGSAAALSG